MKKKQMRGNRKEIKFNLMDVANPGSKLPCKIDVTNGAIFIDPKGYGHKSEISGGSPIAIEFYEGMLRVVAWKDINTNTATVIEMEGARESLRVVKAKPDTTLENKLIAKSRKIKNPSMLDFIITNGAGDKRVVWEYIEEGNSGDYDPKDPDDYPHLRFSCDVFRRDCDDVPDKGDWEGLDDTSYCTLLPINTPKWMLMMAAKEILVDLERASHKRAVEGKSWLCISDFNGKKPL